jgi:hypothetical protein
VLHRFAGLEVRRVIAFLFAELAVAPKLTVAKVAVEAHIVSLGLDQLELGVQGGVRLRSGSVGLRRAAVS